MLSKAIDWFLNNTDLGHKRVNPNNIFIHPCCYLLFCFRGLTNQLEGKITGAKAGKTKLDTHRLNLCKSEMVSSVDFIEPKSVFVN